MDSLKKRILDHVKANQPITRKNLALEIGISGHALDKEIAVLREIGLIYSMAGFGYFAGKSAYEEWRAGIGGELLRERSLKGAESSLMSRREGMMTIPSKIALLLSDGRRMSSPQIADALSLTVKQVSAAICEMAKAGEIKFTGRTGHRIYHLSGLKRKAAVKRQSVNVICQECRQSPAMRRVLAFYGRTSA